ncbi:MAG: NSS family neurotransmitter:Na+ symporter [Candidatus Marinamargulisbacteria bacterium]|jgi:NSS family neurotransmitter:Na+ symporter
MRDRWSSKLIFILAAVGSAIGLGNVWRFPYLVGKYGGGAFLVPYFIILFLLGYPLLVMEFALGQKMQSGSVKAFTKIHPKLAGIGFAAVLCSGVVTCYYSVVMAWTILYTKFSPTLAWGDDTKGFFFGKVLNLSSGVNEIGQLVWPVVIALILSWILIYFCIWKGVVSVGKVVSVTMPLPIIILVILAVRGLFLEGAGAGIDFYLTPSFKALLDVEVWSAAISQIFYTLTLGFGVMISYASFQDKKSDIAKSALITALLNAGISVIAGFVVFSTLGHMALKSGSTIAELAKSGPSLAFIVFPKALSLIPGASFFAVLFFIMLITLAIDSAFSLVEAVSTALQDRFASFEKKKLTGIICILGLLGALIFATQGGLYYLDIVDHFITTYGLVGVGLAQCIGVGWVYGANNLRKYINEVSDFKLGPFWDIAIKYIIPVVLILVLGSAFVRDLTTPYEGYPQWALVIMGWGTVAIVFISSVILSFITKKQLK